MYGWLDLSRSNTRDSLGFNAEQLSQVFKLYCECVVYICRYICAVNNLNGTTMKHILVKLLMEQERFNATLKFSVSNQI